MQAGIHGLKLGSRNQVYQVRRWLRARSLLLLQKFDKLGLGRKLISGKKKEKKKKKKKKKKRKREREREREKWKRRGTHFLVLFATLSPFFLPLFLRLLLLLLLCSLVILRTTPFSNLGVPYKQRVDRKSRCMLHHASMEHGQFGQRNLCQSGHEKEEEEKEEEEEEVKKERRRKKEGGGGLSHEA